MKPLRPRTRLLPRGRGLHNNTKDAPISIADLRKPRLLYTRKPKNRGNAGAGMKVKEFLATRVDALFPGGRHVPRA